MADYSESYPGRKLASLTLCFCKSITPPLICKMLETSVSPEGLLGEDAAEQYRLMGVSEKFMPSRTEILEATSLAKKEIEFCSTHSIDILTPWDSDYPMRLMQLEDFPKMLFKLGKCDLNNSHPLAIVGTRRATHYGINFARNVVESLAGTPGVSIVSGLALGIDAAAHRTAVDTGVATVAVLAHGLDRIYPTENRQLARDIIASGGCLLTEYHQGVRPYRSHFLARNRIIAALSNGTLVAESALRGGAMTTATIAFSLSRSVMALPGRITDEHSAGCNRLIGRQQAALVTSPADVKWELGLTADNSATAPPTLFPELEGDCMVIYEYLSKRMEAVSLDEICNDISIPAASLLPTLTEMEFDGIISRLPGNRFELC